MSKALEFSLLPPPPPQTHTSLYFIPPSQSSPENITRAYLTFINNSITEQVFVSFHIFFEVQRFLKLLGTGSNFSNRLQTFVHFGTSKQPLHVDENKLWGS